MHGHRLDLDHRFRRRSVTTLRSSDRDSNHLVHRIHRRPGVHQHLERRRHLIELMRPLQPRPVHTERKLTRHRPRRHPRRTPIQTRRLTHHRRRRQRVSKRGDRTTHGHRLDLDHRFRRRSVTTLRSSDRDSNHLVHRIHRRPGVHQHLERRRHLIELMRPLQPRPVHTERKLTRHRPRRHPRRTPIQTRRLTHHRRRRRMSGRRENKQRRRRADGCGSQESSKH